MFRQISGGRPRRKAGGGFVGAEEPEVIRYATDGRQVASQF